MYKRLISALLLLAFCFTLSGASYSVIEKNTTLIAEALTKASDAFENDDCETGTEKIKKANELWEENKIFFGIFLNHIMLEKLNTDIPSIIPLAESKSKKDVLSVIEKCLNELDDIMSEQKINIENIL